MPDMVVPLLPLPLIAPVLAELKGDGIIIRRALPFEISSVCKFVTKHFTQTWADEIIIGFAYKPTSVFIAIREGAIIGFGAYECTNRAFFGPTGVDERERGKGIGKALLMACLHGLREMGYAYAIIGAAGPVEFYSKTVGAIAIPGSEPGIYADPLNRISGEVE